MLEQNDKFEIGEWRIKKMEENILVFNKPLNVFLQRKIKKIGGIYNHGEVILNPRMLQNIKKIDNIYEITI